MTVRRAPPSRSSWPALSTPVILLGLGALCVFVAAVVFVSVAWSDLPLAAKAAILLTITAAIGVVAAWVMSRGLRGSAEAMSMLTVTLVVVDFVAAVDGNLVGLGGLDEDAVGWIAASLLVLSGLSWAWAALRTRTRWLSGVQVLGVAGMAWMVLLAHSAQWARAEFVGFGVVVVLLVVAAVAVRLALWTFAAGVGVLAGVTLAYSFLVSLVRILRHDDLAGLWSHGRAVGWVVCVVLAVLIATQTRVPMWLRRAAASLGVVGATLLLLRPLEGQPVDSVMAASAGTSLALAAALLLVRAPWTTGAMAGAAPTGVLAVAAAVPSILTDLGRVILPATTPWSIAATETPDVDVLTDTATPWVVGLSLLAVMVTGFLTLVRRPPDAQTSVLMVLVTAGAVGLGYELPLWGVVAVLGGLAVVAGAAALALGAERLRWVSAGYAALALSASLGSQVTTLVVAALLAVVLGALATLVRDELASAAAALGAVLAVGLAAAAALAVSDLSDTWTAYVLVGLGATVVLAAQLAPGGHHHRSRAGLEVGAMIVESVAVAVAAYYEPAVQAPIVMTVAGASLVAASLISRDRRLAAIAGGVLLASASWVRLGFEGVTTVEAYTLPTALVLLVLGVVRMRRTPGASSITNLAPGLSLALLPSLVACLPDPTSLRALVLGLAALLVLLGGAVMRWVAPLVFGAGVVAVLAVVNLAPYAQAVPRWVLLGLAGGGLLFLGITWERRLRDARALVAAVERLS